MHNIWQYGNTSCGIFNGAFRSFGLKLNSSQMKLFNFQSWTSGKLSKIGHHFRKYITLKIDVIKKCATKFSYSLMKKKDRFI